MMHYVKMDVRNGFSVKRYPRGSRFYAGLNTTTYPKMTKEDGHLQLKIEGINNWQTEQQRTSEPVVIHQLPWIIRINYEQSGVEHLCINVVCNSESPNTRWSCVANVILRLIVHNELLFKSEWKQTFNSQENSCGYNYILRTSPNCTSGLLSDRLLGLGTRNHRHGLTFDTNTIIVEADIKIETSYVPKIGSSLVDRLKYLLSSGKNADVHFLVGIKDEKEQFAAHKGILATFSAIFDGMFDFDSVHGNSDKMIEVADVKPEAFRVMLDFCYTTNLGGLNQENVFDILHAAKKYNIAELIDACADCPKLDVDNVLYALGKARYYDVKSLVDRCWEFTDQNAHAVLENPKFADIDQTLLCDLFARDQLVLRDGEIDIWSAALRWADAQCHKRNIKATGESRRQVLGPALFNIRFPLIERDRFSSAIVPTKVLTKDEMLSLFLYCSHPANGIPRQYPLEFSCKLRVPTNAS